MVVFIRYKLGGGCTHGSKIHRLHYSYIVLGAGIGKPKDLMVSASAKLPSDEKRIDTRMEAEMIFDIYDGQA